MQRGESMWWRAGLRATVWAGLLAVAAGFMLPALQARYDAPLVDAMLTHRYLLYIIAVLMTTVGWVDSVLRYRAQRAARRVDA